MKPISPDPFIVESAGYGIAIREFVMAAVKGSIEACDLREGRKSGKKRADRRQIMRLMQRRERRETLEARDHAMVDQHGPVVIRSAMHDPVTDGERTQWSSSRSQALASVSAAGTSGNSLDRIGAFGQRSPAGAVARNRGRLPMPSI